MDEEKRQENSQVADGISETVEQTGNKPMSAETNPSNSAEVNPEETQLPQDAETMQQEFALEDAEPFDLSPDATSTAAEPSVTSSPEMQPKVEELSQRVEALKAQLEDRNSQYMRLAADFENYRKRTQKEKEDQEHLAKASTIKELLPIVDNFERARSQIKPQTDAENTIHNSYQGVYKDLVARLKKIGVAPMRSEGKPFDPTMHEAVMREVTEEHPEGTVLEELQRGYVLGEMVLRHAMVKVAAAPEEDAAGEESSS